MENKKKRFLIEVKVNKELVYSIKLKTQDKETAEEWGRKWTEINSYTQANPRVVATEIVEK